MEFVVVTGPPCSGKSTWIGDHAGDADVFARDGLGNDPASVARDRSAFVSAHAGGEGACYVESCRMPELEVRPGDTVTRVHMDTDERTCLERLEASGRSEKGRWREIIRSYFSESSPARGFFHIDTSPHGDEGPHGPESEEDMAEETATTPTPTEGDQAKEPQGTETDWKAESRKWEQRAKDNKRAIDELQKTLEGFEAKKATEEAKEQRATEALEAAKAEIKRLQVEAERDRTARDVAKAKGVDPDVLTRMRGDTKDEIEANAELLAQSTKARWPEVKDKGAQKAPGMTREQILAIKNPKEQLRAAARNLSAFD